MPRGKYGQGMAAKTTIEMTNGPAYAHNAGSGTDGEEIGGVGSKYYGTIHERINKSNPRNQGPEREYSMVLAHPLPIANKASRHTGKL